MNITEIVNIPKIKGGKAALNTATFNPSKLIPLPGGSGFWYTTTATSVRIIDSGKTKVVAELDLAKPKRFVPDIDAVSVEYITVDEDFRGQGLARSLYGIVLTIMKKTLVAGSSQTRDGKRNWNSIAQIPGVVVKGYTGITAQAMTSNNKKNFDWLADELMKMGGDYIGKSQSWYYWAFDVVPGTNRLSPAVSTYFSKIYHDDEWWSSHSTNVGLYAVWER
jgi:GNAT superfamily N-acetyltransferase